MITRAYLEQSIGILNQLLERHGAKIRIKAEGRYGYIGLDAYDLEGMTRGTVKTGLTKRAADELVDAMIYVLDACPLGKP